MIYSYALKKWNTQTHLDFLRRHFFHSYLQFSIPLWIILFPCVCPQRSAGLSSSILSELFTAFMSHRHPRSGRRQVHRGYCSRFVIKGEWGTFYLSCRSNGSVIFQLGWKLSTSVSSLNLGLHRQFSKLLLGELNWSKFSRILMFQSTIDEESATTIMLAQCPA